MSTSSLSVREKEIFDKRPAKFGPCPESSKGHSLRSKVEDLASSKMTAPNIKPYQSKKELQSCKMLEDVLTVLDELMVVISVLRL